jgi:GrpB-like predicted nucleotidyltransferase (UPF0157 family)
VPLITRAASPAGEEAYVPALEAIGLQLRSRDILDRFFRPFPGRPREIHVHVCELGSEWEAAHLRFRDYLRTHPEACDQYTQAKRGAAALWADDGLAYTDAKTEVILKLLEQAAPDARHRSYARNESVAGENGDDVAVQAPATEGRVQ